MAVPEAKSMIVVLFDNREGTPDSELHELINAKYTLTGIDATAIHLYRAVDGQKPSLAMFCNTPLDSSWNKALKNEADILGHVASFQQRKYTLAYELTSPSADSSSLLGRHVLLTSNAPAAGHDEDFERFYDEEHIALVAKVPGWLRSRRYKLEEHSGADKTGSTPAPGRYLVVHEFEKDGFIKTPEMAATMKTPWAERILKVVSMEFVKVFERQSDVTSRDRS